MPEACFRHGERELRLPSTLISISPEHFPAKWKPVRRPKMRPIYKGWKGAELPCTTDGSGSRTRARWMFGVMSKTCFQHAQFRAGGSCVIVGRSALESYPARRIQFRGGSQQLRRGVLPKAGKQMAASANVTHGLPLRSPSRAECMETGTQRRSLTRFEHPSAIPAHRGYPAVRAVNAPRRRELVRPAAVQRGKVEDRMAERRLNPNQIPKAHAKEDRNTPGESSGEQCPGGEMRQQSGPVAPTPHSEHDTEVCVRPANGKRETRTSNPPRPASR